MNKNRIGTLVNVPPLVKFQTYVSIPKNDEEQKTNCWLWNRSITPTTDYPRFYCKDWIKNKKVMYRIHRFSYETFVGPIPNGMCVLHRCDNKKCANPHHLFLGTVSDNNKDRNKKGRQAKGIKHASAKLDDASVKKLRELYSSGMYTIRSLGKLFGVSHTVARRAAVKLTWRHI